MPRGAPAGCQPSAGFSTIRWRKMTLSGIGHSTFRLKNGELRQYVDEGEITIAANELLVKCWHCAGPTRVSSTQWPS